MPLKLGRSGRNGRGRVERLAGSAARSPGPLCLLSVDDVVVRSPDLERAKSFAAPPRLRLEPASAGFQSWLDRRRGASLPHHRPAPLALACPPTSTVVLSGSFDLN